MGGRKGERGGSRKGVRERADMKKRDVGLLTGCKQTFSFCEWAAEGK